RHRHRYGKTSRGAVVLVDHDVEPDLVTKRELVEVAVEQAMADLGVEVAARQHDPQRPPFQTLFPGRVIGHFREIPDAHGSLLRRFGRQRPKYVRRMLRVVPNAGSGPPEE